VEASSIQELIASMPDRVQQLKYDPKAVNGVHLSAMHWAVFEKIKQLSKKHSYCYASNSYIASLVKLSRSRVAHIITDLCNAGMLFRRVHHDDDNKNMVIRRDLVPVPEKIYKMIGQETADLSEKIGKFYAAMSGFLQGLQEKVASSAQLRRIFFKASRNGVSKLEIVQMLRHPEWSADYIEEKIGILTAHIGTENPTRFLWAALWKNYKLGKRAQRVAKKETAPVKVTLEMVERTYEPRPVTEEYEPDQPETAESLKEKIARWLHPGSNAYQNAMRYAEHMKPATI